MKSKKEVKADAIKMKAMLRNPRGWKIRVWENLGWYSSIEKGGISLRWSTDGGKREFYTLMSETTGVGDPCLGVNRHFINPNKAIDAQLKKARSYIKKLEALVERSQL